MDLWMDTHLLSTLQQPSAASSSDIASASSRTAGILERRALAVCTLWHGVRKS